MRKSVGILLAMREELAPLQRHWKLELTGPGDFYCGRWAGMRIQVALSGVGQQRAQVACRELLRYGAPDLLVSFGYSGGLRPELRAGDCIVADSIKDSQGNVFSPPRPSSMELHGDGWLRGQLLCVETVAQSGQSKRELALQHPESWAVDMESAVLARVAQEAGIPWRSLRVIVDPIDQSLPIRFHRCMGSNGQTHPAKLAREILTSPHRWHSLVKFAGLHQSAQESLVRNSSRFLEALTPW